MIPDAGGHGSLLSELVAVLATPEKTGHSVYLRKSKSVLLSNDQQFFCIFNEYEKT